MYIYLLNVLTSYTYSFKMTSSNVIISHRVPQDTNLICVSLQSLPNDRFYLQWCYLVWVLSNKITQLIPQLKIKMLESNSWFQFNTAVCDQWNLINRKKEFLLLKNIICVNLSDKLSVIYSHDPQRMLWFKLTWCLDLPALDTKESSLMISTSLLAASSSHPIFIK